MPGLLDGRDIFMSKKRELPETVSRRYQQITLTDDDIRTVRVDRRSFLAKALAAGSIGVAAAATAACPGGTDSTDGGSDGSDSDSDSP